jgi:hypothetical protein
MLERPLDDSGQSARTRAQFCDCVLDEHNERSAVEGPHGFQHVDLGSCVCGWLLVHEARSKVQRLQRTGAADKDTFENSADKGVNHQCLSALWIHRVNGVKVAAALEMVSHSERHKLGNTGS